MKTSLLIALSGVFFAASGVPAAAAQTPQPFELLSDVKVDKVSIVDGAERHALVDPAVVVPGDRLVFSTRYRNNGAVKAEHIVVTNPIKPGIMLASDGAALLDVSVDGGKSWGKLAGLNVPDGQGGQRAAQSGDVTHVRWVLASVAPGASGTLSFNAIVR